MSAKSQPEGKINVGLEGAGGPTIETVERRAAELALVDGRAQPTEADRQQARAELTGIALPESPEAPPEVEEITTWDEPAGAAGFHAEQLLPTDESTIGSDLVEEGLEEADHDSRVASAREQRTEKEGGA